MGATKLHYLKDDPPQESDETYTTWIAEDAQIRVELWNSIEPHISNTLVFLPTAKLVQR